ncbi:MAG: hypothetical protein UX19_C0002G0038 [Candidatus Woesebacteria bacterium GW2011_GWA1_45_8]|uniref:Uncharacterized protein n=1 Tax=Candidatus Woesebacteria bacterium GW2011_GWA1_45_8 TaxID=1618559 RepID=A0A0G1MVJ3_9BACT|nr:MAG: hypothetical protein UX19_C0002G0038 [Candidatus Woesebacteria bacterium GW2011_GWA1_45_8]
MRPWGGCGSSAILLSPTIIGYRPLTLDFGFSSVLNVSMKLFSLQCAWCNRKIYRRRGRINEALKFGWRSFCSNSCIAKSHNKQTTLTCSRPGCNKLFKRTPAEIKKVKFSYCSHLCAVIVGNSKRQKKIRICANHGCKNQFIGDRKYCSPGCIPIQKIKCNKKFILSEIRSFEKKHGRIPFKREFHHNKAARLRFGSWNNAIKAAGFHPNPVMFADKFVSKDGHKCDSLAERIIDDWLFSKDIKHERNILYPGDQGLKVDFKIRNYWVEFFGLSGEHIKYDRLKRKKFRLAKKFNLTLVRIYPNDLFPKSKLVEKFAYLLK